MEQKNETIEIGATLIAIDECEMSDGHKALKIGKEYPILGIYQEMFWIRTFQSDRHYFNIAEYEKYFKIKDVILPEEKPVDEIEAIFDDQLNLEIGSCISANWDDESRTRTAFNSSVDIANLMLSKFRPLLEKKDEDHRKEMEEFAGWILNNSFHVSKHIGTPKQLLEKFQSNHGGETK